jgi:hypothetical protein
MVGTRNSQIVRAGALLALVAGAGFCASYLSSLLVAAASRPHWEALLGTLLDQQRENAAVLAANRELLLELLRRRGER